MQRQFLHRVRQTNIQTFFKAIQKCIGYLGDEFPMITKTFHFNALRFFLYHNCIDGKKQVQDLRKENFETIVTKFTI